jgi:hypothetical protein
MDLNKLSTGDKIAAACGIVLIIDLLFFPWHSIDTFVGTFTRSAVESPNSFWGVLALLITIAVVAVIIVRKLTTAKLPDLPIPWPQALFYGAIAALALLVLKLIMETEALGFGSYIAILLAAGMTYGAFQISKEGDTAGPSGVGGVAPPPPPGL